MTYNRRESDRIRDEITTLISKEDDPGKRALLMVLNSINLTIAQASETTSSNAEKLDNHAKAFEIHVEGFAKHAKHEEALLNKGRGAWWALAWALGIAQMVGGYVIVDTRSSIATLQAHASQSDLTDAELKAKLAHIKGEVK